MMNTLDDCMVTEIGLQNEKCFRSCIYRSPSQNQDDILLSNINNELQLSSVVTGQFNAHCSKWWKNGITNLHSHYKLDIMKL